MDTLADMLKSILNFFPWLETALEVLNWLVN